LAHQKGVDIALHALPDLVRTGARIAVLGDGEHEFTRILSEAAVKWPDRVAAIPRFDDALAHRLHAGGDFFLMPSRYEPCGLGQMIAQRYGTPPIVRNTGGLADTVRDRRTGFVFGPETPGAHLEAVDRAIACWRRPGWDELRQRCMRLDWSWPRSAQPYERLYLETLGRSIG